MRIVLFCILFIGFFLLFGAGLLYSKGLLTGDTFQQARESVLGKPEPEKPAVTQVAQIPDQASEFVRQLQQEQRQLKDQQAQIDADRRHLAQEREELNELNDQISKMLTDIEVKRQELQQAASQEITNMAETYKRMKGKEAADQLAALENELAVPILRYMKAADRAIIFKQMNSQRAVDLQRELLSTL